MSRQIIVALATSADGFIAGKDGDMEWLTSRPKPAGFYGMGEFMKTVDAKIMGRKTYEEGLKLGAKFNANNSAIVFSRSATQAEAPPGVEFVSGSIESFVKQLRAKPGKNIWLMGGGDLIASFLDANAIDEFVISVSPVFLGDGIPLLARRHRHTELKLVSATPFEDGVVQLRYEVR